MVLSGRCRLPSGTVEARCRSASGTYQNRSQQVGTNHLCMKEMAMASVLRAVVVSLVLLVGAGLGRTAGLGESINRWVGQLGDDNFGVREQASQKLWAAGRA